MRSFVRTRYGCDFCKKVGGSKFHMAKHERGCTNNPQRVCSLHEFVTCDDSAPTMDELKAALTAGGWKRLIEVSHNCPACKLAALRQTDWGTGQEPHPFGGYHNDGRDSFDFKAELAAMWATYNELHPRYEGVAMGCY